MPLCSIGKKRSSTYRRGLLTSRYFTTMYVVELLCGPSLAAWPKCKCVAKSLSAIKISGQVKVGHDQPSEGWARPAKRRLGTTSQSRGLLKGTAHRAQNERGQANYCIVQKRNALTTTTYIWVGSYPYWVSKGTLLEEPSPVSCSSSISATFSQMVCGQWQIDCWTHVNHICIPF